MGESRVNEQSWTTIDKTDWGEGDWQSEPDKIVWVDSATNLDCMIQRGPLGALCGYVGVPSAHPAHGCDCEYADLFAHGGLTYAGLCDPDATPEHGICHVAAPGRDEHVWWFGFDCAHAFDVMPGLAFRARPDFGDRISYKNVEYVRAEVTSLAAQISRTPSRRFKSMKKRRRFKSMKKQGAN